MKHASLLIAAFLVAAGLLALSSSAQSRPPKPTEVKGHVMGESVAEFFARAGQPELLSRCRSTRGDKKEIGRLGLVPETCAAALAAESGARVRATDPKLDPQGPPLPASTQKLLNKMRWAEPARPGSALLSGAKLAQIDVHVVQSFSEVLPDLLDKYGQPLSLRTDRLQNAYGATFDVGRAS